MIAARQEITRQKWPEIVKSFDIHISALVIQEAEQGDAEASRKRLEAISRMPVLPIRDDAERLAMLLIEEGPILNSTLKMHFILPSQQQTGWIIF